MSFLLKIVSGTMAKGVKRFSQKKICNITTMIPHCFKYRVIISVNHTFKPIKLLIMKLQIQQLCSTVGAQLCQKRTFRTKLLIKLPHVPITPVGPETDTLVNTQRPLARHQPSRVLITPIYASPPPFPSTFTPPCTEHPPTPPLPDVVACP